MPQHWNFLYEGILVHWVFRQQTADVDDLDTHYEAEKESLIAKAVKMQDAL